ncbi:hypothetical protein JXB27_01120, partial [Candidatus Woesearchaeota archaeon]|nr:hypothetical protein [Candidatus Woesearchaeota archaeon]
MKMKKAILILMLIFVIGCSNSEPTFITGNETLEIELLGPDSLPLSKIEIDLWQKDAVKGPPNAGYIFTDENGIAVFKVPEGEYQIGFNYENFPTNLIYPAKEPIAVGKGMNKKIIMV